MAKNNNSTKTAVAVGAGLATVAAAAAAVYFMTGKNAGNRKKIAKWAKDLQNDVVSELDKAGKATKASYGKMVDQVAKKYEGLKNVSREEIMEMASDLKNHWTTISAELSQARNTVRKITPKKVTTTKVAIPAKKNGKKK